MGMVTQEPLPCYRLFILQVWSFMRCVLPRCRPTHTRRGFAGLGRTELGEVEVVGRGRVDDACRHVINCGSVTERRGREVVDGRTWDCDWRLGLGPCDPVTVRWTAVQKANTDARPGRAGRRRRRVRWWLEQRTLRDRPVAQVACLHHLVRCHSPEKCLEIHHLIYRRPISPKVV